WDRMDKLLEKEEAWLRRGVKARTTRNEGRVRALEELRAERAERREHAGRVRMEIQDAERSGALVMKIENLDARADDRVLFTGFTATLERGDRAGIIGPNGCGKTTLLRLLLNEGPGVRHGTNLRFAYADQIRAALDDNATVRDTISSEEFIALNGSRRHVLGYLEDFLFTPDRARQKVGVLSGGERNRLLLAKLFAVPANLLVLDEPTNDLDLDTLDILEEQLAAFDGTVLLVSHDREFLNHTATRIWAFESDEKGVPRVVDYAGNYDDYSAALARRPKRGGSTPTPVPQKREQESSRQNAKKPTWKEARRLEELPGLIESLETEQSVLHARFADPSFYASETRAADIARDAEITRELESLYAEWAETT
ncbi:MAG: ATP-binding cassette domain-containing protein, partial [Kiritimatiellaeota bacterium]|nr:ATP-binding cassette domain-containing protein [Kiritimatiellota bacterium]